jgi:Flp pilus assembly protein TadG
MNMARFLQRRVYRRGSIIPLSALLMVPLLGLLAFTIDLGYIVWVATELQTAADAAALAGAERLQALSVQYTMPNVTFSNGILTLATTNTTYPDPYGKITMSPMATAETFSSYNQAGNVAITLRDEDVTFGFTDAGGKYHSNYRNYNGGFPNSITVIARRDQIRNGPVSLFFGPILGLSTKSLTATATATIYSGDVTSVQVIPGVSAHILPVALDMNIWKAFYATGQSSDGTVHFAATGYPQLQVYPCDANTPGSCGLLDAGASANKTPAFQNWSGEGDTPNDLGYFVNHGLLPVSVDSPKSWKCGPVLQNALVSNIQNQRGVPNLLPLFIPASAPAGWQAQTNSTDGSYGAASGTGENATYAVVGFAGVAISQAESSGSGLILSIQPCAVVDPTALIPNPKPAGTQSSQFGCTINNPVITTFISAKLTQ